MTSERGSTNVVGGVRRIYKLVNVIANKPKKPPCNLTSDKEGNPLQTPDSITKTWMFFLNDKFKPTVKEGLRPDLEPLPKIADPITRKEFDLTEKLNMGKVTGPAKKSEK